MDEAPKHLQVLEEYTGLSYTMPKMDLMDVKDLSFGEMEKWGMNSYQCVRVDSIINIVHVFRVCFSFIEVKAIYCYQLIRKRE